jgi:hypothetical protein
MKFKCGKCNTISEVEQKAITKQEQGFAFVKCSHCSTINKIPFQPVAEKEKPAALTGSLDAAISHALTPQVKQQPNNQGSVPVSGSIPAWIMVHDENTRPQTFELKTGKNLIGRKASVAVDKSSVAVDNIIGIETEDIYMSRGHCIIEVLLNKRTGEYNFLVNDFKSTNGTIINAKVQKKLGEQDIFYLNDGDTIQLGMTKVVLRKNHALTNRSMAESETFNSPHMHTVVLRRS